MQTFHGVLQPCSQASLAKYHGCNAILQDLYFNDSCCHIRGGGFMEAHLVHVDHDFPNI